MTNKKEVAQAIWNTYVNGYSEALLTPVEQFDTYLDPYSKKIIADILRALAKQSTFADTRVGVTEEVVLVDDILKIADELENL